MPRPRIRPTPPPRVPWGWAGTGAVLGLVLATVLYAPAHWLARAMAWASAERVQLQQAQGSLWNGTARLVLAAGNGTTDASALPGRVQWRIQPHWRGVRVTLSAPCCLQAPWVWEASASRQGLQLRAEDLAAAASHWPAQLLGGLGTPWNTVQLQGTLALHTQGLHITVQRDGWALQGNASVDGLGLSTALSTLQPLGSYRFALQGGASPLLTLSTLSGQLQLSGQGQLVQGRWRFRGEARADDAAQGALGNLLNIIGRREGARSVITVG